MTIFIVHKMNTIVNLTLLKVEKLYEPHYTKIRFSLQNTGLGIGDIVTSQ